MTKSLAPTESPKSKVITQENAIKNFDYTTIVDRLRTVSLSDDNQPTV